MLMKVIFPSLLRRNYATVLAPVHSRSNQKVKSWQVHEYGDIETLQLGETRLPVIDSPDKVLVQVHAASLNPIDLLMIGGYGRTLFKILRGNRLELPLTVGRDFSGTIISKGLGVRDDLQIGDEVYGFVPLHKQGTFSETVIAEAQHVLPKPKHLSHLESTSLTYATMTAWSALFIFGNLLLRQRKGLRILILGASGGVGTTAVQLLKSQDCLVFGTCSANAVELVYSLGADCVFNYNDPDYDRNVESENRYHIILDCAKIGYQNIPKSWKYDTFITLNSPLLINTDNYGLMGGMVQSLNNLLEANISRCGEGSMVKWGFFIPSPQGFRFIDKLIKTRKLKPMIHKTFLFDQLPDALKVLSEGHLRGKIVIDYSLINQNNVIC